MSAPIRIRDDAMQAHADPGDATKRHMEQLQDHYMQLPAHHPRTALEMLILMAEAHLCWERGISNSKQTGGAAPQQRLQPGTLLRAIDQVMYAGHTWSPNMSFAMFCAQPVASALDASLPDPSLQRQLLLRYEVEHRHDAEAVPAQQVRINGIAVVPRAHSASTDRIGLALYPAASLINHSCIPPTCFDFEVCLPSRSM